MLSGAAFSATSSPAAIAARLICLATLMIMGFANTLQAAIAAAKCCSCLQQLASFDTQSRAYNWGLDKGDCIYGSMFCVDLHAAAQLVCGAAAKQSGR
jgi:hypothetical protein